jgi:trk system potassium uptake protein TrkA
MQLNVSTEKGYPIRICLITSLLLEDYSIIELSPPKNFVGKSLRDLDLINRFGVQVIAVKELVPDRLNMIPTASFVIKDSDILIMLGPNESFDKLKERN